MIEISLVIKPVCNKTWLWGFSRQRKTNADASVSVIKFINLTKGGGLYILQIQYIQNISFRSLELEKKKIISGGGIPSVANHGCYEG